MGVRVSGATCVGTTPPDASQAGFFVVGGKADSDDYPGLQKYTFATGNWTTIKPTDQVTKNRQWHSSTYIRANDAILVYAGNQDGIRTPSTQTFTIQASDPYTAQSYQPGAPAALSPALLDWSEADAAMVGGGTDSLNSRVYLFNPTAGWRFYGASLSQPLRTDTASFAAALVDGDDSSKSLYTFDLGQTPNKVSRIVLQDENGAPLPSSTPISGPSTEGSRNGAKRDLTLNNWPTYNASLAPRITRQDFAMAQGLNGVIIFSGGNKEEPVSIFDSKKNAWVDSGVLSCDGKKDVAISGLSPSSTASPSSLPTATTGMGRESGTENGNTSAETANPARLSQNAIIGVSVGSAAAFLLLLGLLFFWLRRRKQPRTYTEAGLGGKPPSGEKPAVAFVKRSHPKKPAVYFRGHHPQSSQDSYSSMAILMGRMGKDKPGLSREPSNGTHRSSVSSLRKQFKSTISKPIPHVTEHPALQGNFNKGAAAPVPAPVARPRPRNGATEVRDGTRRSSGWNRYWSGGSALQLLGFGSGTKRNTAGSEQSSLYSEAVTHNNTNTNTNNARATNESATIPPPLAFEGRKFEGQPEVNSVNSGSPIVAQFTSKVPPEGMAGKIERPASSASSGYSSGILDSMNDTWKVETVKSSSADKISASGISPVRHGVLPSSSTGDILTPHSGVSKQPQLAMAATSSDMSWLNLGDQSRV